MPRPALNRQKLTAQIPGKLLEAVRTDALAKGYKANRRGKLAVDWQGYLGRLFRMVISEEIEIPRKGVDDSN